MYFISLVLLLLFAWPKAPETLSGFLGPIKNFLKNRLEEYKYKQTNKSTCSVAFVLNLDRGERLLNASLSYTSESGPRLNCEP